MGVITMTGTPQPSPASQFKERLKWIASILLAASVVCCGCGFFVTTGLVARGELTASFLGTDLRLWRINANQQVGLGLQRSWGVQRDNRSCIHYDVTFVFWRPGVSIENSAYEDCG